MTPPSPRLLAVLGYLLLTAPVHAQRATEVTVEGDDLFGSSVAVSGDYMVVGAPHDDDLGTDAGAVYVYVRSGAGWAQQAKLSASDGAGGDRFGSSVAVSGDRLVVGVPARQENTETTDGAAYVFARNGTAWEQQARLASDGSNWSEFGASVAIDGDYVVVGSTGEASGTNTLPGAAYVFVWDGASWARQAKLKARYVDHYYGRGLGGSVAISGGRVVVGNVTKSAHVFVRSGSTWTEQGVLSGYGSPGGFARSVAISGDRIAVAEASGRGAAYVYAWDGSVWQRTETLYPDYTDPDYAYSMGRSMAMDEDYVVAGGHEAAYVYARTDAGYTRVARLAPGGEGYSNFGASVALGGDGVVVGDPTAGTAAFYARQPVATPGPVDFSPYQYSATEAGTTDTLRTTFRALGGTTRVTAAYVSDSSAFSIRAATPFTLAPGEGVAVEVLFTPPADGAFRSHLVFEHDGTAGRDSVLLTGKGVATGLAFSPAPLSFPAAAVGVAQTQDLYAGVRGLGSQVTVTRVYTTDPALKVTAETPFTIPRTEYPRVASVEFTPAVGGPHSGYVYFEHDGTTGRDSVLVGGYGQYGALLTAFGTQTVPTNYVNVLFRATDAATGRGIDIPADDLARDVNLFALYDGGQPMSPTAPETFYQVIKLDAVPHRLRTVLLLDNSTSVGGVLPQIREAARALVDDLVANQDVALYVFSGAPVLVQDFTRDRQALHAAIDGIGVGEPTTNLYGSMIEGLSRWDDLFRLTERGGGEVEVDIERGFLVVLSDGNDLTGAATLNQVLDERGDRQVFTVGFGQVNGATLQTLGNAGYYPVPTAADLAGAFAQIQEDIALDARGFYWLNYSSPRRGAQTRALQVCLNFNTVTSAEGCARTSYNSEAFSAPPTGVYVDRSVQRIYGVDHVEVPASGVTLTATTVLGLNAPAYTWTSSDETQVVVEPVAGTNQAVARLVEPSGGGATITVTDTANNLSRTVATTAAVPTEDARPSAFDLGAPYPNPSRGPLRVELTLPSPVPVRVEVYDALGRLVSTSSAEAAVGGHALTVETSSLAAGPYVLRVTAGGDVAVRRFSVVR